MILYTNERGEIKDVGSTTKSNLNILIVSDEDNPFEGWSKAKICCYKVQVQNERITMLTPYVDSRIVEQLGNVGESVDSNDEAIMELAEMISNVAVAAGIDFEEE